MVGESTKVALRDGKVYTDRLDKNSRRLIVRSNVQGYAWFTSGVAFSFVASWLEKFGWSVLSLIDICHVISGIAGSGILFNCAIFNHLCKKWYVVWNSMVCGCLPYQLIWDLDNDTWTH